MCCGICMVQLSIGIRYPQGDGITLVGYNDADWEDTIVDRKSTFGHYFSMESRLFYWYSRKQKYVALSSAKVEYIVTNLVTCEVISL